MLTPLALDTETALITAAIPTPPLACMSYDLGEGAGAGLWHHSEAADYFEAILADPSALIVGANIAYDARVMMAHAPWLTPAIFQAYADDRFTDVAIRQKLSDIAGGVYRGYVDTNGQPVKVKYSLADLAKRHLGIELDKDTWRLRYGELIPYPLDQWPDGAREYPVQDAMATLYVYQAQESNAEYLHDQFRQTRAALWLSLTSAWGICTDPVAIDRLARLTQLEYDTIAADLRSIGLLRPDKRKRDGSIKPGSRDTKKAKPLMVAAHARSGKPLPLTDGNNVSLEGQACEDSGDPDLYKYAQLSKIGNTLSTKIPLLLQGSVTPIHARFEDLLTTGRTSTEPNIQNQSRKFGIRECFVPRDNGQPDNPLVFISADYSGAELCTLAQACITILGRSALGEAMNGGQDPHLMIASQLSGVPYPDLRAAYKAHEAIGGLTYDEIDKLRQTGKVANFGFPGGLGPASFVAFALGNYQVRVTEAEAVALKRVWLQTWPEMGDYFRWVNGQIERPFPTIEQLFSKRHRGNLTYTEACNTMFQGLAADMAKDAGFTIARACYADLDSPLFGCRPVNFVHDENILEAPERIAHEAATELARLMREAGERWLPDVRVKAEPLVSRVWSKKAKPVHDANGRLIPWQLS